MRAHVQDQREESGVSVDDGLRALFRKRVRDAHWQTIERLLDRGVPDANVCLDSSEVWIEFKATRAWHVRLRAEQVGWLLARERHGGRTVIAVRRHRRDCDQLWMIRGDQAALVQERGLVPWIDSRLPRGLLGTWDGGPSRWNWEAVRAALACG
jgi:hypothetical protein